MCIPNLHATSASPIYPTSHLQTIVRKGNESITEHVACAPHGPVSVQGFLQTPEKHACLLGQSASIEHCGLSSMTEKIIVYSSMHVNIIK